MKRLILAFAISSIGIVHGADKSEPKLTIHYFVGWKAYKNEKEATHTFARTRQGLETVKQLKGVIGPVDLSTLFVTDKQYCNCSVGDETVLADSASTAQYTQLYVVQDLERIREAAIKRKEAAQEEERKKEKERKQEAETKARIDAAIAQTAVKMRGPGSAQLFAPAGIIIGQSRDSSKNGRCGCLSRILCRGKEKKA